MRIRSCTGSRLAMATLLLVGGGVSLPSMTFAQEVDDAEPSQTDEEIVVTARKRAESLISVPVAITAIGGDELSRSGISGMDAIARKIPGLVVGEGGATIQGGTVSLRGISASDSNPLGDQAVSFNIDGVQVARASVRRMGNFDTAQVEVLKGPQALFYGKNSPGGIVSLRTNDPSDIFEAGGKIGYEFNAHEVRGDAYISGPIADGLGIRLAGYFSDMRGWVKNETPATSPVAPLAKYSPDQTEFAGRLTLKYDDGGPFKARFKFSVIDIKNNGMTANYQNVDCPNSVGGRSGTGDLDDCSPDDHIVNADIGPNFANMLTPTNPLLNVSEFGDGRNRGHNRQYLSGLELNYNVSDEVTVTSVTGFYNFSYFNVGNFTASANLLLGSLLNLDIEEISQEIRLTTNMDAPVNFMVGGQYQSSTAKTATIAGAGSAVVIGVNGGATPPTIVNYAYDQKGSAYSAFAQVQIKPIDEVEISIGGRLSHEEKELRSVFNFGVEQVGLLPSLSNGGQKQSFDDFSPEITLTYRPSQNLTAYGSYKRGFLSGGYNGGSVSAAITDFSYRPQIVKGWEAGIKGRFFDNSLTAELAVYDYDISDLQVTVTTGVVQQLRNAGQVSSKGAEFSLAYDPPIDGLTLYGNVAYAKGRYDQYYATCYTAQLLVAPGTGIGECAVQPNPTDNNNVAALQNLSGTELLRSPKWSGNAGFVYETRVSDSMKIELSGGMTFSDSYVASPGAKPGSRSPAFTMFDATLRLAEVDEKWNIALIGRNLTEEYYFPSSGDNISGNFNPTVLADTVASPNRGREIMLRIGFRY